MHKDHALQVPGSLSNDSAWGAQAGSAEAHMNLSYIPSVLDEERKIVGSSVMNNNSHKNKDKCNVTEPFRETMLL
jgi:hypothetical protein